VSVSEALCKFLPFYSMSLQVSPFAFWPIPLAPPFPLSLDLSFQHSLHFKCSESVVGTLCPPWPTSAFLETSPFSFVAFFFSNAGFPALFFFFVCLCPLKFCIFFYRGLQVTGTPPCRLFHLGLHRDILAPHIDSLCCAAFVIFSIFLHFFCNDRSPSFRVSLPTPLCL